MIQKGSSYPPGQLAIGAIVLALVILGTTDSFAQGICRGGQGVWKGGNLVGCVFPSFGPAEESQCKGGDRIIKRPSRELFGTCHVCISKQYASLSPGYGLTVGVNLEGAAPYDFSCLGKLAQRLPIGYRKINLCDCKEGTWVLGLGFCVGSKRCTIAGLEQSFGSGRIENFFVASDSIYPASSGENCHEVKGFWSKWLDRDNQSGSGDFETLKDFPVIPVKDPSYKCKDIVAIECRTVDKVSWVDAAQQYRCDKAIGGVCSNASQARQEQCEDYEIRVFCKHP